MHGGLWVEFLRPLIRHQRLVHLVLAQFREVALELRQVVVPRVLAHLVERARDRAVVAAAALVALVQLPGVVLLERLLADFDERRARHLIFQRLQSRSHFLTFKATLTLHSHSHFLF